LELKVQGYARALVDVDDTLDTIAVEIEDAMDADIKINDLALDSYLETTEFELDGEGDRLAGLITLTYKILYQF
jgi:hypothetical protein